MATIVLDPGHSDWTYKFPNGYREGVLVRKTAIEAKKLLSSQGHNVLLTREKPDENPPLSERACLAVKNKAKIFVSIHTNAITGIEQTHCSGVYGIFFANNPNDTFQPDNQILAPNGRRLAQLISQEISLLMGLPIYKNSNAGAMVWYRCPANLGVLSACDNWSKTEAACLIEAGYADNPSDMSILSKEDAHIKYALGICRGIYRYAGWSIPRDWDIMENTNNNISNDIEDAIKWLIENNIDNGDNIIGNYVLEKSAIWLKKFNDLI